MPNNETKVLGISRLLTPEHKADLRAWVNLAYAAENSVRRSLNGNAVRDSECTQKPREYSCGNNARRSKK